MQVDSSQPSPQKHVLLVDPETDFRKQLIPPFELFGYDVRQASCGHQALARFDREPSEVVVTELALPDLDGVELIRRLRARTGGNDSTIVALTALPFTSPILDRARASGCDLVLTKAYPPWVFAARIDQLLRRGEELRAASQGLQRRAKDLALASGVAQQHARAVVKESTEVLARSSMLPLMNRIRGRFLELPGMVLTLEQAAKAWDLDVATCERVLDELVRIGFLQAINGTYRRR